MPRPNGGPYVAPTSKMLSYVLSLARERTYPEYGADATERVAFLQREVDERRLGKHGVMSVIDRLRDAPRDVAAAQANEALRPGVYRRNGDIYVVKLNRSQTALYAKRLVQLGGGRRLLDATEEVVKADFEYAPGAVRELRPRDLMTLEEARGYLVRYTHCMVCGRALKDATSVLDSIGPVCRRMFLQPKPTPEPDLETADRVASLLDQLRRI